METNKLVALSRTLLPDMTVVVSLLIAGWKYTFGIDTLVDVSLSDEAGYLSRGVTLLRSGFPHAEDAPLYAAWYALLALFTPDRIALFYSNYVWLTVLPPILIYLVLRRFQVSIVAAAIVALFYLITAANLPVAPKVNHFALIVLLVFFLLASFCKTLPQRFVIVGVGCLFAAYVRPELYLAFLLCMAAALLLTILRARQWQNGLLLAFAVVLAFGLGTWLGFPVGGGTRSLVAFGQHFSINWLSWTHTPNLSEWTDWQYIVELNFGKVSSMQEVVTRNPGLVLRHVLSNLTNSPNAFYNTFSVHANLFLPFRERLVEAYLLPLLLIGLLLLNYRSVIPRARETIHKQKHFLILTGAIGLVLILSILLIFPRPHYTIIVGVFALMVLAMLLDPLRRTMSLQMALVLAVALVAITPSVTNLIGGPPKNRTNLETIQFFRSLRITAPVTLLTADGGYAVYLSSNYNSVPEWIKNKGFNTFREERKINMVLAGDRLHNDTRFRDDPEWKLFLVDFKEQGFAKIDLPDGKRTLYVDTSLLPPSQ